MEGRFVNTEAQSPVWVVSYRKYLRAGLGAVMLQYLILASLDVCGRALDPDEADESSWRVVMKCEFLEFRRHGL